MRVASISAAPRLRPALLLAVMLGTCFAAPVLAQPCTVPDNGHGTVNLPPPGCGYLSPADVHKIIAGLAPGDTVILAADHEKFINVTTTPGGSLGGEIEHFQSTLILTMTGTGSLAGLHRTLSLPANCETHTAPRTPGDPVQSFDTEMFGLQGQLPPGDPDFDLLRVTAGNGFGLPSPGHTTLTLKEDGNWNVDSFFDITYRIDFVGHPGSILGGHSGSTTGTIRMSTGQTVKPPPGPCVVADDGSGTVHLPPTGCGYVSPDDLHRMINGLPPGTTIEVGAQHQEFFGVITTPGGPLGGETEQFHSILVLTMTGTGPILGGYHRNLTMQVQCMSSVAPRTPGNSRQSFDTEMDMLQGQLPPGDPDFDLLRITAGNSFGLPSPGHTTLAHSPTVAASSGGGKPGTLAGSWNVDSFFDITYRIDFVGHPGGPLGGMSGSTTGTIRMQAGQPSVLGVPIETSFQKVQLTNRPNPFVGDQGTTLEYRLPQPARVNLAVYDAAGSRVRLLTDERLPAGPHAMMWDGRNEGGRLAASGTYFVKLAIEGKVVASAKATIVK